MGPQPNDKQDDDDQHDREREDVDLLHGCPPAKAGAQEREALRFLRVPLVTLLCSVLGPGLRRGTGPRRNAAIAAPLCARTRAFFQSGPDRGLDLGDSERVAADLRQRLRVDQELVAKHRLELTHVHLGHQDMFEALQ